VDEAKPTDYIGREALQRIKAEGVKRKLAGIEIEGERIEFNTTRWPVTVGGETAGAVTSAIWSPRLKKNIGYAMLPVAHAVPGTALRLEIPGAGERKATVVALPFMDPGKEIPKG
jgi:aminomethyltransferase